MEPGTEVHLYCKQDSEEYFAREKVEQLARHYGSLLPYPVSITVDDETSRLNEERPPWKENFPRPTLEREAYMRYGRETFAMDFFDYIPLRSTVGDVQGVAFVLPFSPSLAMKRTHRVYLMSGHIL